MLNYPGYIYLIENEDSFTHKASSNTLYRFLEGCDLCYTLIKGKYSEDVIERLFSSFVNMLIFILIKLDNLDEGIQALYDFENSYNFKIILNSKLLNLVNSKIMNKQFLQAKIIIKMMASLYNNKKLEIIFY